MKLSARIRPRLRLWAIYNELGYNPWRKPRTSRKCRTRVYMGTREAIPFLNDDGKRTFSHLLFRPGYMMRDYILRGQHERYLAPFTAMLVFYSFFTLIVAVVQPKSAKDSFLDSLVRGLRDATVAVDSTGRNTQSPEVMESLFKSVSDAIVLTRLDKYPELADTPWKESLAAVEGDIRSKGIPLFLGSFILIWIAMAILLRKYGISRSGAAAASGYVLCQFCIFMFLALLFSLGQDTRLGLLLMGVLLFIDYRQMLGVPNRKAMGLTVRTGIIYVAVAALFYLIVATALVLFALSKADVI